MRYWNVACLILFSDLQADAATLLPKQNSRPLEADRTCQPLAQTQQKYHAAYPALFALYFQTSKFGGGEPATVRRRIFPGIPRKGMVGPLKRGSAHATDERRSRRSWILSSERQYLWVVQPLLQAQLRHFPSKGKCISPSDQNQRILPLPLIYEDPSHGFSPCAFATKRLGLYLVQFPATLYSSYSRKMPGEGDV
jgi:hypothetical protein